MAVGTLDQFVGKFSWPSQSLKQELIIAYGKKSEFASLLWSKLKVMIFRPHRTHTIDPACCYWHSLHGLSVSVHNGGVSCKSRWTDWDAIWYVGLGGPWLDGSGSPQGTGQFGVVKGSPIVNYKEHEASAVERRLAGWRWRLVCGLAALAWGSVIRVLDGGPGPPMVRGTWGISCLLNSIGIACYWVHTAQQHVSLNCQQCASCMMCVLVTRCHMQLEVRFHI